MALIGKFLNIKFNGSWVACSTSCKIDTEADTHEKSAPGDGNWRKFLVGRKSWSVTCSWLIASDAKIAENMLTVGSVAILETCFNGSGKLYGRAICRRATITASNKNLIQGSFEFIGDGALSDDSSDIDEPEEEGGAGGEGSGLDETLFWQLLGTTIAEQVISTEHLPRFKTVNGESIFGTGNIEGVSTAERSNWNTAYNFVNSITGSDADDVINKWDEIVAFLDGISETDKLNNILSQFLRKDYLDSMFVPVDAEGNQVESVADAVAIKAKLDLFSVGEVSAYGMGAGSGGSSSASTLFELDDTNISNPAIGQVLQYNGTSWVNAAAPSSFSASIQGTGSLIKDASVSGSVLTLTRGSITTSDVAEGTNKYYKDEYVTSKVNAAYILGLGFMDLTSAQTASGVKTFSNGIKIGKIVLTEDNGSLKVSHATSGQNANLYATGEVSAYGMGAGSSGGSSFDLLTDWSNYASSTASSMALGANLGKGLLDRIASLEGGSALTLTTTGSGNAVTAISKSGTAITATKGATFALSSELSSYLPLAGGTMSSGDAQIGRVGKSVSWVKGRDGALVKNTSYTGYNSILSMKTTSGSWELGVYTDNKAYLTYITDSNYTNNNNATTYQLTFPQASGTIALTSSNITGNAATATAFASAKSIALTGDVTGSASSTGGWSIATTIGSGKVTNAMLAGSIANGKLANSSMTIAGTSVSLGGSISAATIGNALTTSAPAAYATSAGNADTVDNYHIADIPLGYGNARVHKLMANGHDDTTWKVFATVSTTVTPAPTTKNYIGYSICGTMYYQLGNYGQQPFRVMPFQAVFHFVGSTIIVDTAYLYLKQVDKSYDVIRIVKVTTNSYELQVRQPLAWTRWWVEASGYGGATATYNTTLVTATNTTVAVSAANATTINGDTANQAYQLVNSRTLWGQSFNGTANVSGNMTDVGSITASGNITTTASVGIGTTSPSYKLHCLGNGYFQNSSWNIITLNRTTSGSGAGISFTSNGTEVGNLGVNGSKYLIYQVSSATKWQVDSNGNMIAVGEITAYSDIRKKDVVEETNINLEDIANAPLFKFVWNDREDDKLHIGTSAQYWLDKCPNLVSGDENTAYSLNYGVLGTAMGISIARHVRKLEQRIKELETKLKMN